MSRLSIEQSQAVAALTKDNVVVLAGPGSGKSYTLLAAVNQLLALKPQPRILCLTFTNKTADNLKNHLDSSNQLFVGTFHALAAQILKTSGEDVAVASEQQLLSISKDLERQLGLSDSSWRELLLTISRYKNGASNLEDAKNLVDLYNAALLEKGLMDYDDLILRSLELAEQQDPYGYILIDEFQDTSPSQYQLLRKLSANHTHLFVIGDPKQAIYRFRGADDSVLNRLLADYKPKQVNLSHNYRSTDAIIDLANQVFPDQIKQIGQRHSPGLVQIVETLDDYSEADYIFKVIEQALGGTDWQHTHHDNYSLAADSFSDFAVLYRTRRQGELLAKRLRGLGLPVQCLGEDSPYTSPKLQLIITILNYDPQDHEASQSKVIEAAAIAKVKFRQAWLQLIDSKASPCELVKILAEHFSWQSDSAVLQLENLASRFNDLKALTDYLNDMTNQSFFDPLAGAVSLSTIHTAKGLEFRHVFLAGCNEGLLPSHRAIEVADLAEEKRLFYVAITRARDSLTIIYRQQAADHIVKPSIFLKSLEVRREVDPSLEAAALKRTRWQQKRAQGRLF